MRRWLAIAVLFGCGKHPRVEQPVHGDQIAVIANEPGATAQLLESTVATPLETAITTKVGHLAHVRTTIREGSVKLELELDDEAEPFGATTAVQEALQPALRSLPSGMMPPLVMLEPDRNAALRFAVRSDALTRVQVTKLADDLDLAFERTPGVLRVELCGAQRDEWRIDVDPPRLAAIGLTLAEVLRAVRAASFAAPAGHIAGGSQDFVVRAAGAIDDLPGVTIATRNGAPVRLRDVANVALAGGPVACRAIDEAGEVVTGAVSVRSGGNAQEIREALDGVLAKARLTLPPGAKLAVWNPDAAEIAVEVADLRDLDRARRVVGSVPAVQHVLLELEGVSGTARVLVAPHTAEEAVVAALRSAGLVVHARDEIVVAIDGPDPAKLAELANSMLTALQARRDVVVSGTVGLAPQASVRVEPDRVAAARYGIDTSDITDAMLAASTDGLVATSLFTQAAPVDVVVRVPSSPQDIDMLRIASRDGVVVPLSQVAKIEHANEAAEIRHFDGVRWVGIAASGDAAAIRGIVDKLALPAGYRVRLVAGAAVR